MKKILLALLISAPLAYGLDTLIEPKAKITKNIFFVLDKSCSMSGDALTQGIRAVEDIALQSTDELNIAVVAFSTNKVRWPGVPHTEPDGGPPYGWAAMPSQDAGKNLMDWMNGIGPDGGTNFTPAFHEAMTATPPRKGGLTVVIISDGAFDDPTNLKAKTEELQKSRIDRGMEQAVLVGYKIGDDNNHTFDDIVKVGPCGGLFHEGIRRAE